MLAVRPRTVPPLLWPSLSTRPFSSTPTAQLAVRHGSHRNTPVFDWRKPYKDFPRPSVTLISSEGAANTYLESLTSKRLTIHADPGHVVTGIGMTKPTTYAHGALAIADGEGVLVLHLARMKRAPEVLISILEDPTIEKQKFGIIGFLGQITNREHEFFGQPESVNCIDLRLLAKNLHPRLNQYKNVVVTEFMVEYAKDAFGMQLDIQTSMRGDYSIQMMARDKVDDLVNECWFTHIAGSLLRSRLETKIAPELDKLMKEFSVVKPGAEPPEHARDVLLKAVVEKELASYRFGASEVKEIMEMNGTSVSNRLGW
ncbi:hypothetical protein JCM16303_004423 [Sporobolomyces ruberrimus]